MNNSQFLKTLKQSFLTYCQTGARSPEKLKCLHGAIAQDLLTRLGAGYSVAALGYGNGKEKEIAGRYMDKKVDIMVSKKDQAVAAVGVKFVMSNYGQNSNNYFENMLGETANIRCNRIPYFQIFIIPDNLPYFKKNGEIKHWEQINQRNLNKYVKLSQDDIEAYFHTPNKTLIFIVNLPECAYQDEPFRMTLTQQKFKFGQGVVYNDYEEFAQKITYSILSI